MLDKSLCLGTSFSVKAGKLASIGFSTVKFYNLLLVYFKVRY